MWQWRYEIIRYYIILYNIYKSPTKHCGKGIQILIKSIVDAAYKIIAQCILENIISSTGFEGWGVTLITYLYGQISLQLLSLNRSPDNIVYRVFVSRIVKVTPIMIMCTLTSTSHSVVVPSNDDVAKVVASPSNCTLVTMYLWWVSGE